MTRHIDLRVRQLELQDRFCAIPSGRAGRPSARAVLRRLGESATIAIAVFAAAWFAACLISAAGQL